jgi:hypothetical protein
MLPLYNKLALWAKNNRPKNQNKTGLEALPESDPKLQASNAVRNFVPKP